METLIEKMERERLPTKPIPPPLRIVREPFPLAIAVWIVLMVGIAITALAGLLARVLG